MPKLAANLSMMFNEVEFLDRFEEASKAGFNAVEFMFPYDYSAQEISDLLDMYGLKQVLHNLPAGDWDAGDRGIATDPNRMGEFQDGVGLAIDYATKLHCPRINCLAGIPPKDADPENSRYTLVSNLKFAAAALDQANIKLLIEPINTRDIPGFYLNYSTQALSIIKEVASSNIWLQYDIYHMQIMEGDLTNTINANLSNIDHIQIADNPGRNEPGTGEINYPMLFEALELMGYDGWIGCEYRPLTTTVEGLKWATEYLEIN